MIVFDIIRVVPHDAGPCSYERGRHLIDTFDSCERAESRARIYNSCCRVRGVYYEVVAIDEEDPARNYDDEVR